MERATDQAVSVLNQAQQLADSLIDEAMQSARDLLLTARSQQRDVMEQAKVAAKGAVSRATAIAERAGSEDASLRRRVHPHVRQGGSSAAPGRARCTERACQPAWCGSRNYRACQLRSGDLVLGQVCRWVRVPGESRLITAGQYTSSADGEQGILDSQVRTLRRERSATSRRS